MKVSGAVAMADDPEHAMGYSPKGRLLGESGPFDKGWRATSYGTLEPTVPQMDAQGRPLYAPWQPIESAPKDGTEVLLYDGFESIVCQGCYAVEDSEWVPSKGKNFWQQPTHWKPLDYPDAP